MRRRTRPEPVCAFASFAVDSAAQRLVALNGVVLAAVIDVEFWSGITSILATMIDTRTETSVTGRRTHAAVNLEKRNVVQFEIDGVLHEGYVRISLCLMVFRLLHTCTSHSLRHTHRQAIYT